MSQAPEELPAERQVGFIAQEVQSVLPQLVSKDRDGYLIEFVEYHEGTPEGVPDPKKVG